MEIKDIENLAQLAKLDLTQTEKENLLSDMEGILSYVKQIENVEVEDTKYGFNFLYNNWREDEVLEQDFDSDLITNQFPESKDNFLKVKKIL